MPSTQSAIERIPYTIKGENGQEVTFYMIKVPPGKFLMGDDDSAFEEQKPAHWVEIKEPFEIGQLPVTQELWEAVMGKEKNQSYFKHPAHPVEIVSAGMTFPLTRASWIE